MLDITNWPISSQSRKGEKEREAEDRDSFRESRGITETVDRSFQNPSLTSDLILE